MDGKTTLNRYQLDGVWDVESGYALIDTFTVQTSDMIQFFDRFFCGLDLQGETTPGDVSIRLDIYDKGIPSSEIISGEASPIFSGTFPVGFNSKAGTVSNWTQIAESWLNLGQKLAVGVSFSNGDFSPIPFTLQFYKRIVNIES